MTGTWQGRWLQLRQKKLMFATGSQLKKSFVELQHHKILFTSMQQFLSHPLTPPQHSQFIFTAAVGCDGF